MSTVETPGTTSRGLGILRTIGLVVALLLLMAAAILAVSAKHLYIVTSGSMVPTLRPGDVVYVSGASFGDLQVGDVISFDAPGLGEVVTHRIVSIGPDGIVTKGDFNELPDGWRLHASDIRGEMTFRVPKVGLYLSDIRRSNLGFLAVTAPLVVLVLIQSKSVAEEWRKWRRQPSEDAA